MDEPERDEPRPEATDGGARATRPDKPLRRALGKDSLGRSALGALLPAMVIGSLIAGFAARYLIDAGTFDRGGGLWLLTTSLIACFGAAALILAKRLGEVEDERRTQVEAAERSAALLRASEDRVEAILSATHESFIALDASGVITDWNSASERTFGWSAEEAIGRRAAETFMPPELRNSEFNRFLRSREPREVGPRMELEAADQEGRRFPVELTIASDPTSSASQFNAFLHEITGRRMQEQELRRRGEDLAAIAEATGRLARTTDAQAARDVICEVASKISEAPIAVLLEPSADGGGLAVTSTIGAGRATDSESFVGGGGAAEAFVNQHRVIEESTAADRAGRAPTLGHAVSAALWQPVMQGESPLGVLAVGWKEAIKNVPERTVAAMEMLAAEATVAVERAALLTRLEAAVRTDDLTGLPNRRSWDDELEREIARAERTGAALSIALIDIDDFKRYNGNYGRQSGDRMLRAAAGAWRSGLRITDVLSRYGGDEFSLLLPDCSRKEGLRLLERLRESTPEGITCSVGIAEWDRVETIDTAVGRAETALNDAKRRGRNRTCAAPVPV